MTKTAFQEKRIQMLVEKSVSKAFRELLADPDRGLELTPYAKRRLRQSLAFKRRGKTILLDAVLTKYQ